MPLSQSAPREDIHRREVTCRGFRRDDGLWEIEGHLVDTKSYSFDNAYRGRVHAGTPVHEMWLRLTIDDDFTVRTVEAVTDHGPFRACPEATPNFQRLVGLTIKPGWNKKVRAMLGGPAGCTHLVELLGPMATTAFQTIWPLRESQKPAQRSPSTQRPRLLDSCYALASDGDEARRMWPEFYTGKKSVPTD